MAQKTPYVNFHSLNLDWIIKRIKNVYNDENPPPYPVRTVNGQVGNVHLTGDDIPVSPNDTTPISTELNGKYTKPAGGIPASDLAPGVIPDPTSIIDDNAGYQAYDKTWSAHKLLQMESEIVDVENDIDDLNDSITQIHSDITQRTVYRISGSHPAAPIYPPADIGYSQTYIISAPPTLADNFRVIGYYIPQEEYIKDLTVTITPGETQTIQIDFLIASGSPSGTYEIYIVSTDTTGGA
jgi:hypothetical protein